MKTENENTQNKARIYRIVVTDLQEDKTLMDLTANAAIINVASPFDNLANVDRDGHAQGALYFNCGPADIFFCIQNAIEGIGKLTTEHKELGLLLNFWLMLKQLKKEKEDKEDE